VTDGTVVEVLKVIDDHSLCLRRRREIWVSPIGRAAPAARPL
jgi:hypothetical protein